MTDEELLERAERLIQDARDKPGIDTDEQMMAVHTASIATSLLVIARNSLPLHETISDDIKLSNFGPSIDGDYHPTRTVNPQP